MEERYEVILINSADCVFDSKRFDDIQTAKKWAAGRCHRYRVTIFDRMIEDGEYPVVADYAEPSKAQIF